MSDELTEHLKFEEDGARRIAQIVGPSSAAARALETLDKARAKGLDAVIFREGKSWIVANRRTPPTTQTGAEP